MALVTSMHSDDGVGCAPPDTHLLACQLSAARDDAEDLRRALTRKEVEIRTLTTERNTFQDEAARLRHELDSQRRAVNDLTNVKLELAAAREVLQQKLADALEEIARREDQRVVEQAVLQNLQRQQHVTETHSALLQERLAAAEADFSRRCDEMRADVHRADIFRSLVTREVANSVAVMERSMQVPDSAADEAILSDLALLSLVAPGGPPNDLHSSSSSSFSTDASLRDSASRDAKSIFHPIYDICKTLCRHFADARADRRRLREYQQHQQQHVDVMAEDLTRAVQERAQLLSKVSQCELQLQRLSAQSETVQRASEELEAKQQRHLSSLASTLHCVEDWTVVEAQTRNSTARLDLLQTRCREQQEDLAKLKDSFAAQQQEFEDRLLREAERMRQQKDESVKTARESTLRALEEKDRVAATADHVKETTVVLQLEHDQLRTKFADSLAEIDRLAAALRQAQRDTTQLQAQVTATMHENELLLNIQAKQQRAFDAERQVAARRTQAAAADAADGLAMTHFEALVLALRVLHGYRRDVGELCEQRRALCAHAREMEQRSGALLASMQLPARIRVLLRFRRAAIVVLAANRLRRLLKPLWREVRCPARRSALRIRLPADAAVFVTNGLLQRVPERDVGPARYISDGDVPMPRQPEASNLPSVVGGLLLAVRAGPVLPPAASPNGPLCHLLQTGLHRLLIATVRTGAASPGNSSRALVTSSEDDRRVSPARTTGRRSHHHDVASIPKSALKATPRHFTTATAGNSSVLQHLVSPSLVSPAPSARRRGESHRSGDMSSQSYGDDFTLEVLNVIRALDTKVTGALRRPHLALS
jgi:hypothetical protein